MTDASDQWDDQPAQSGPDPADSDDAGLRPDATSPAAPGGESDVSAAPATGTATAADGDAGANGDQVQALEQERDTYLDLLRRERAEFENYRRRSTRERAEALDRGAQTLMTQLLDVLDNFGYVLEAAKDHDDAVAKGVRMVHAELRDVLGRAGLQEVPGVGSSFDPTWHDAVMQVDGDEGDDGDPAVAQVLRAGYQFKGRVLRPASVAVTQ